MLVAGSQMNNALIIIGLHEEHILHTYMRKGRLPDNHFLAIIYVTGFGKTLRMGFFQKIEFDAWLISSTIELTHVQVLGRSCAWLWGYSALFAIAPHPQ